MGDISITGSRYSVESLYQWDSNQTLVIYGLSLPKTPEIHFTNSSMEHAVVRQATMDDAGVVSVGVPNSLLQKALTLIVHVCIYEGETFKTLYTIEVPIKARKQPADYTFVDDANEIYSYNALEYKLNDTLADYDLAIAKYDEAVEELEESKTNYDTAVENFNSAVDSFNLSVTALTEAKTNYNNASGVLTDCQNATADCRAVIDEAQEGVAGKENKATITKVDMLASGWSGNTYSFENTYPSDKYNIEIALDSAVSKFQFEAFTSAQIVGSATSNVVTAFGDVPTVDLVVIVKAVRV